MTDLPDVKPHLIRFIGRSVAHQFGTPWNDMLDEERKQLDKMIRRILIAERKYLERSPSKEPGALVDAE